MVLAYSEEAVSAAYDGAQMIAVEYHQKATMDGAGNQIYFPHSTALNEQVRAVSQETLLRCKSVTLNITDPGVPHIGFICLYSTPQAPGYHPFETAGRVGGDVVTFDIDQMMVMRARTSALGFIWFYNAPTTTKTVTADIFMEVVPWGV